MLSLTSMLFCVSGITTGNETVSFSDVLGAYLDICGTIISSLNCYPRSLLNKVLVLVIIEVLIICSNGYEKLVLHATPYHIERETVNGFPFTTKGVL